MNGQQLSRAIPVHCTSTDFDGHSRSQLDAFIRASIELFVCNLLRTVMDGLDDGGRSEKMVLVARSQLWEGRHGTQIVAHIVAVAVGQPNIIVRVAILAIGIYCV